MKEEKGITLISLVVTVIILIILAGVSINLLLGQYGIVTRAQEAKKQTQVASITENIKLKLLDRQIEEVNTLTQTQIEEVLLKYGTINKNEDGSIKSITTKEGNYEIAFEDLYEGEVLETYNKAKNVNAPELLTGMSPIKFTEATEIAEGKTITTNANDENWYNYANKKWANAQTQDGSMWVWIPRYAYKITYYTDETKQTISETKTSYGSTDVVFLIGTENKYYDETNDVIKNETDEGYTVHPAFTTDIENGGWDKELTGIWVAKFEAGYASGGNTATVKASNVNYTEKTAVVWKTEAGTTSDSTQPARNWLDGTYAVKNGSDYEWKDGKETAIKYPVFQGSTYSMNYINHNDAFRISKVLTDSGNIYGLSNSNADSHLMKNSEWGAVAYLSKSKYGLGNTDIAVNKKSLNNSVTSVYAVTGYNENNNKWNEYIGTNLSASTTGNIYGIYDMSGGTWERTAGIVSNGNGNLYTYGKAIIDEANVTYTVNEETGAVTVNRNTGASTKYVTIYPNNDSVATDINDGSQKNYEANTSIYGDAIRETSTAGTLSTSWYGDNSFFPALNCPFFLRGGGWENGSYAGLFYFTRVIGHSGYNVGFRSVLVAR